MPVFCILYATAVKGAAGSVPFAPPALSESLLCRMQDVKAYDVSTINGQERRIASRFPAVLPAVGPAD
jgi:hypothetical protein